MLLYTLSRTRELKILENIHFYTCLIYKYSSYHQTLDKKARSVKGLVYLQASSAPRAPKHLTLNSICRWTTLCSEYHASSLVSTSNRIRKHNFSPKYSQ